MQFGYATDKDSQLVENTFHLLSGTVKLCHRGALPTHTKHGSLTANDIVILVHGIHSIKAPSFIKNKVVYPEAFNNELKIG